MRTNRPRYSTLFAPLAGAALLAMLPACSGYQSSSDVASDVSLYALVQGIDGVYFYPPLGPDPVSTGAFEADLLDGITVSIEAEDAAGATVLATFNDHTTPAVALLAEHERYWVNIPAATYVTDPSKTYRIRVALDGSELATSVLTSRIFDVMAQIPTLPIGVAVRIEGSGAVRAVRRSTLQTHGAPAHCSDGRRNKDETGVDCGGSCAACPTCTDGIQNQGEAGIDCGGPCGPCATCTDHLQNQGETGVDCGGPCAACPLVCAWSLQRFNSAQGCFPTHSWPWAATIAPCTTARIGNQYYLGGSACSGPGCQDDIGNGAGNPVSAGTWVTDNCKPIWGIGTCRCN